MARVFFYLKITIYIFCVLLSFTLTVSAELSKACAYHSEDAVVIVLNQNSQDDIGSFVTFLSTGIEPKSKESFLDINHVDYKIDDLQLYRYNNTFNQKWRKVTSLKSYKVGPWLALVIPKKSLLLPENKLTWRVALFPKGRDKPIKSPLSGPSVLNLEHPLKAPVYQGKGIPLDVTLAATYDKKSADFRFTSGDQFEHPAITHSSFVHNTTSLENLSEPLENTIFFDSKKKLGKTDLNHEVKAALRVPPNSQATFFELPELSNPKQNNWLNDARALASSFIKAKPFFQISPTQELPLAAAGGVYSWQGDLKVILASIKKTRKSFQGPLWYDLTPKYVKLQKNLKKLSYNIWLEYQLLPMLKPKYSFESTDHHFFTDALWQKTLLLQRSPIYSPKPLNTNQLKPLKRIAPEAYLKRVLQLFNSQLQKVN